MHVLYHQANVAVSENAGVALGGGLFALRFFFIQSIILFYHFQSSFAIILESSMLLLARKDHFLNESMIDVIFGPIKQNKDCF